jgi:putative transposase
MKIRKAYQFKLKPSHKQQQQLLQIAGSCRFLWNKVLAINEDRLRNRQKKKWYQEADYWSKLWKHSEEYGFLKEAPAHCLQQKLKDLEKAFKDGLDKSQSLKRIPKFKKKERHNSFRFPEPKQIRLDNRRIKLPKIGWIGFYKSREIDGEIKNVTVSEQADDWTISIQVEQEVVQPVHASKSAIGIDLGVSQFAAMSDNTTVQPINSFRAWEKRLAKAQKQLAKKKKRSQNWKKQVKRIQKLHCKIKNLRSDFLHKLSTQLCKSHALIVVEDLKITNMSRSASGTLEKPGKQIKAKSGLNKSILDQGWGEFRRQLEYKLDWLGGVFLKVDPRHTSQRCHVCGHTEKANRQSQALFKCTACSHSENADTNAAKNILAAGHAVLACGEKAFALSMKQEPPRIGNLISV